MSWNGSWASRCGLRASPAISTSGAWRRWQTSPSAPCRASSREGIVPEDAGLGRPGPRPDGLARSACAGGDGLPHADAAGQAESPRASPPRREKASGHRFGLMPYKPVDVVEVRCWGSRVGAVALDPRSGYYAFEYDPTWTTREIELAPTTMPTAGGASTFVFPTLRSRPSTASRR